MNPIERILLASEYLNIVEKLSEEDRLKLKDVISKFTEEILKEERLKNKPH